MIPEHQPPPNFVPSPPEMDDTPIAAAPGSATSPSSSPKMPADAIYGFHGEYRFLSNFWMAPITIDKQTFPSTEHAFAAAKTLDPAERAQIAALRTPSEAKRVGRNVTLRSDWEVQKNTIMEDLVRLKFSQHPDLASRLVSTGDRPLVEANTWGDRTWGVDATTGQGENRLGKILMNTRERLREREIGNQRGSIDKKPMITREMLRANPDTMYVFGDNALHVGFGGQAAQMRGEANAIGIPTKWEPSMSPEAFFLDSQFDDVKLQIDLSFDEIERALAKGHDVVFPAAGIGTGLARLQQSSPLAWTYLQERLQELSLRNEQHQEQDRPLKESLEIPRHDAPLDDASDRAVDLAPFLSMHRSFEMPLVDDGIHYRSPALYLAAMHCQHRDDRARIAEMSPREAGAALKHLAQIGPADWHAQRDVYRERALGVVFAPGTQARAALMASGATAVTAHDLPESIRTWVEPKVSAIRARLLQEPPEQTLVDNANDFVTIARESRPPAHLTPRGRPTYAGIGSRRLDRNHPVADAARAVAVRLEALGYVLRSGGADGADSVFECAVRSTKNMEISRPTSERSRRLPKHYAALAEDMLEPALALVSTVHAAPEYLTGYVGELHARNVAQIFGPRPFDAAGNVAVDQRVDFVVLCATPNADGSVGGGTATAWALAREHNIPTYNLKVPSEAHALFERLNAMEHHAGLERGPTTIAEPHLRGRWDIGGAIPPPKPIRLFLHNIKTVQDTGNPLPSGTFYIGRTPSVPDDYNLIPTHLGNPFMVGRDGGQGVCAAMHANDFARKIARGDEQTVAELDTLAREALKTGELHLACHCCKTGRNAPACHGDAVLVAIGERVAELGMGVEYMNFVGRENRRDLNLTLSAVERRGLAAMGIKSETADRSTALRSPWSEIKGTVVAASNREVMIDLSGPNGSAYRILPQPSSETLLKTGERAHLLARRSADDAGARGMLKSALLDHARKSSPLSLGR